MARLKDKVTIAQEETIPNIWNGTMFGDLDWPLNTSRGFVSVSWASCFPTSGRAIILVFEHDRPYPFPKQPSPPLIEGTLNAPGWELFAFFHRYRRLCSGTARRRPIVSRRYQIDPYWCRFRWSWVMLTGGTRGTILSGTSHALCCLTHSDQIRHGVYTLVDECVFLAVICKQDQILKTKSKTKTQTTGSKQRHFADLTFK